MALTTLRPPREGRPPRGTTARDGAAAPAPPPSPPQEATVKEGKPEALSEEILLVLSAAVAAFLGKKAHIRQVRLLDTGAWSQQGRVTIQASHNLAVRHG